MAARPSSGRKEHEQLPVSIGSAYEKLGNLPLSLSEAMLKEGTARLQELLPVGPAVDRFPLPRCTADGFEVFGADGKAIKHVKRLLKPLRGLQAGILGARASVALNLRTGMAVGMVGHLDGEAGEAALTEDLLPMMAGAAGVKWWLVVLDRLYCNLGFPRRVLQAGGHFLIRYCSNTTFVVDPTRAARESRDARGRRIVQEWGRLGKTGGDRACTYARITVHLADGKQLSVITDLLDEVKYPGEDMLETYHKRWGIETVFHQITDVFSLRHLIGSSPQAVLFQMSLCLLLYNTLQVVPHHHLADHQKCEAKKISNEKLFYDVKRQLVSVSELVGVTQLLDLLGEVPTAAELRDYLRENLRDAWSNRWWKAPSSRRRDTERQKRVFLAIIRRLTVSFKKQKREQSMVSHTLPEDPDSTAFSRGGRTDYAQQKHTS